MINIIDKNKVYTQYKWILSFIKIGCIAFGGGNALIPIIEQEMVFKLKLINKEDYDNNVIISTITSGALTLKIAASIGEKISGLTGMFLAPLLISLPGCFGTVILLSVLSHINTSFLTQIKFISISIYTIIIFNILKYIQNSISNYKNSIRPIWSVIILFIVFVFTSEKNIYFLLGISRIPIFNVSSIDILLVSFFIILYTNCSLNFFNFFISFTVALTYLLFIGKSKIINNFYIGTAMIIIMFSLSFLAIYKSLIRIKQNVKHTNLKCTIDNIIKLNIVLLCSILISAIFSPTSVRYIFNVFLSSFISFGGGNSYITIADSLFVSSGLISTADFYGLLIIIVNSLPGSTLAKVLSGIGYYIGLNLNGSIITAYIFALLGFISSVTVSCIIYVLNNLLLDIIKDTQQFKNIKHWISIVISGLLLNIILTLINECTKISSYCDVNKIYSLLDFISLFSIYILLKRGFKIKIIYIILIIVILQLIIGNIFFM